jgi:polar amino acid transport system substrate-binding protein
MKNMSSILIVAVFLAGSSIFIWRSVGKTTLRKNESVLIVGTNAEYPPFSYIDNNEIVGFDIDLIHEVGRRLDKQIQLQDMPFDALLPKLQLGDIQIVAAGLTATPDRAKKVLFTKPHLQGDPFIVVTRAGTPAITSIQDLIGKEVVVNEGFTADLYMSSIPGVILKRLSASAEAFLALQSGNVDAFVAARSSVKPYFDKYGEASFNIFTSDSGSDNASLAISKKHAELVPLVQQALDAIEQDGTLDMLKQKWNLV